MTARAWVFHQLRAVDSTRGGTCSAQVAPPAAEPLTVDVAQVRARQAVVEDDGARHPGQQAQDDDHLEHPEPVVVRRAEQRGNHDSPHQVPHHGDDAVMEQVRRADELRLGVGGARHVAVDGVVELAVEDGAGERQSEQHGAGLPPRSLVPPLAVVLQVADGQPDGCSHGDTQEEVTREDPEVLLERVGDAAFEADSQEFGNDQHDQRGQPGRPARTVDCPPQSRDDAEVPRRQFRGHVLTSIDQTSDAGASLH